MYRINVQIYLLNHSKHSLFSFFFVFDVSRAENSYIDTVLCVQYTPYERYENRGTVNDFFFNFISVSAVM